MTRPARPSRVGGAVRRGDVLGRHARGSAYLAVLGGSLLVTVIGIGAIGAAQSRRAAVELEVSAWKARLNAQSGIDLALQEIAGNANWRKGTGTLVNASKTGDGAVTVVATDPTDGDLADSADEPVVLTSTGTNGAARHVLRVTLGAVFPPLSCLNAVLVCGGSQDHIGTIINNDQTIAANGTVNALLATVGGRVEAAATVLGLTYTGTIAGLQPARELPSSGSVLDTYAALATSISFSSVPTVGGKKTITGALISPNSTIGGGGKSAAGVYLLDCGGADLIIKDSRILGTLVLKNAGSGTTISGVVNWSPATAGYPLVLIDGSATVSFDSASTLSEATLGVNFNPSGAPYGGVTDSDTADTYPSELRGLVYVSGSLTTSGSPKVVGTVIVEGGVSTSGSLTLQYDSTIYASPPPGFTGSSVLKIVAGSWQQVVE